LSLFGCVASLNWTAASIGGSGLFIPTAQLTITLDLTKPMGHLSVINFLLGGNVDVSVNGKTVLTNVTYGHMVGALNCLDSNPNQIQVYNSSTQVLIQQAFQDVSNNMFMSITIMSISNQVEFLIDNTQPVYRCSFTSLTSSWKLDSNVTTVVGPSTTSFSCFVPRVATQNVSSQNTYVVGTPVLLTVRASSSIGAVEGGMLLAIDGPGISFVLRSFFSSAAAIDFRLGSSVIVYGGFALLNASYMCEFWVPIRNMSMDSQVAYARFEENFVCVVPVTFRTVTGAIFGDDVMLRSVVQVGGAGDRTRVSFVGSQLPVFSFEEPNPPPTPPPTKAPGKSGLTGAQVGLICFFSIAATLAIAYLAFRQYRKIQSSFNTDTSESVPISSSSGGLYQSVA